MVKICILYRISREKKMSKYENSVNIKDDVAKSLVIHFDKTYCMDVMSFQTAKRDLLLTAKYIYLIGRETVRFPHMDFYVYIRYILYKT